jgi:mannose-6-phosphate isomerase-like protein (cupin superfamily)
MKASKIISQLQQKYPGKPIYKNDDNNPTEIICEIEKKSTNHNYSKAVAIIDKTKPHFHTKAVEEYQVLKGELTLYIVDEVHQLKEGEKMFVLPGQKHWAKGDETWIECYSEPGWKSEDHIFVKE